jgi:hypothetical protein
MPRIEDLEGFLCLVYHDAVTWACERFQLREAPHSSSQAPQSHPIHPRTLLDPARANPRHTSGGLEPASSALPPAPRPANSQFHAISIDTAPQPSEAGPSLPMSTPLREEPETWPRLNGTTNHWLTSTHPPGQLGSEMWHSTVSWDDANSLEALGFDWHALASDLRANPPEDGGFTVSA